MNILMVWQRRSLGGEVKNVLMFVAVGVSVEGFKEILWLDEADKEDKENWKQF